VSSESHIESMVVYYAKSFGAEAIKQTMFMFYGVAGWPDHVFLAPKDKMRPPLFIEFKTPEGKLSQLQRDKIKWLRENGYPVYCCRSIETGKLYIDHWLSRS